MNAVLSQTVHSSYHLALACTDTPYSKLLFVLDSCQMCIGFVAHSIADSVTHVWLHAATLLSFPFAFAFIFLPCCPELCSPKIRKSRHML
jgi:hypothetical protein